MAENEYYANFDLQGWQMQKDSFKALYDMWVANEPQSPTEPSTYTMREIDEPTEIQTPDGPMLVTPPSVIMTDSEDNEFAVTQFQLEKDYTPALLAEPRFADA